MLHQGLRQVRRLLPCLIFAIAISTSAMADIKIGVFGPMTGDAAANGRSLREAVDFAVKAINDSGGVLGEKIVVIYGDDAGKPEQAVNVAKRLATSDKVLVLLGSTSSPSSLAASQVALQEKIPQIVIAATAQRITTQGNPWVFRSAIPDTNLQAGMVDFVAKKWPDKKKIGFIYVNDDFGKGGLDTFKAPAEAHGIKIVAQESYAPGDQDFAVQLSRIRGSGAEILVDVSRYTAAALILQQARQMGVDLPYVGSDPKFWTFAGAAAEGALVATPFSVATSKNNKVAMAFIEQFRAAYQKDPDYTAGLAYDAVLAVFHALKAAGSADRTKLRDALKTVKFDSVRGPFEFDQKGDPKLPVSIMVVKGGQEADARAQ